MAGRKCGEHRLMPETARRRLGEGADGGGQASVVMRVRAVGRAVKANEMMFTACAFFFIKNQALWRTGLRACSQPNA